MYFVVQLSTLLLHADIVYNFSNFADKLRRQILFKFNKNWKYIFIEAKKSKQSKENYSLIIKMSFFSTKNFFFF